MISFFFAITTLAQAQSYDLLLKGGHVIDPKNYIDRVMDVAVKDGKITQVASNISSNVSAKVIDASGLYVTPGLIGASSDPI